MGNDDRRSAGSAWRSRIAYVLVTMAAVSALIALPQGTAAPAGTALQLNGTNQYATLGTASQLRSAAFTVELWFKRTGAGIGTSTGTGGFDNAGTTGLAIPLIAKGRAEAENVNADFNYLLGINSLTGKLVADFEEAQVAQGGTQAGLNHPISGTAVIAADSVWHHAAATYDGTTWNLYLDGVLDGTASVGRPANALTNVVTSVGSALNTTNVAAGFFAGVVDEVRIWNNARSQAQIQAAKDTQITSGTGQTGLLGVWNLNEGANATLADSSGNAVAGATVNSPTWVSGFEPPPPPGNYAAQLNGTNQYATLGTASQLRSAAFTVELWFKRTGAGIGTSTGTGGFDNAGTTGLAIPLIAKGRAEAENVNADFNYLLGINSLTGKLVADFEEAQVAQGGTQAGLNHPISGTAVIAADSVWHHAAATYDGTTWNLYLDGVLDGTASVGRPANALTNVVTSVGSALNTTNVAAGFFAGVVDEVRIWNNARSQAQIQAAKDTQITSGTGQTGLLGVWNLNEGANATLADSSGNAVAGATVNSPTWVSGFEPPPPGNTAPNAPTLNAPADAANGISTSPTLDVGVSDPDGGSLTVTYFGRPFASGNYVQIAQHSGVTSGTNDSASWSSLGAGQTFQWRVTVSDGSVTTTGPTWTFHTVASADPVFVGAGDIADCTRTQDEATAAVIGAVDGTVWTSGDNVYPTGMATYFNNCYEPSWGGAIKARTRPVPGNHDWDTDSGPENLDGYFGYFGANANAGGTSYYSYDIPDSNWHVVNLDSECQLVPGGVPAGSGCTAASAQGQWLDADLAANSGENVIAIWHKPRYSSGVTNNQALQPFWDALYAAGVDILLVGHDHIYERFMPMKSGATLSSPPVADATFGIRQFTVGSGGAAAQSCPGTLLATSQACNNSYGVMKLTLHDSTYDWVFLPVAGSTFTDSGTGTVHGAPVTVPGAPTIGTATAGNASATVNWTAPASNGGSAITGYVVTPYIGATAQSATTVGVVTSTSITGLTNGTSYTFRVAAINSVGTGAQSADSNAVTPATVPGAPTIGTATAGNASATVNWTAPASNGGSAITGYVVTPYIGATAQSATTVGVVTSTSISGLSNGTSYTFRVAAINSVGTGAQSANSNAVTPVAPNSAPAAPTLNAPANAESGVSTSPALDVGVSDPDANPLTVTYFGRPFASGNYVQIAQNSGVTSGTDDSASWSSLGAGQTFQWYVTVSDGTLTTTGPTWTFHTVASADPVFVGSGDIASCAAGVIADTATGEMIREIDGTIFTTGDNVYPNGTAGEFAACYETTPWGDDSVQSRTRPVPGNHDWGTGNTENLDGYFGYYGANANAPGPSYYSYDIPDSNWHVVNLDSECQLVPGGVPAGSGCAAGSAQELWLEGDLAANSGENVIAIWHKPRYSSGATDYQALQPLWDDLYAAGVDILLDGHDHIYERTAPMKSGATLSSPPVADPTFGIRQFTIGTGGEAHHGLGTPIPTSEVSDDDTFGIFKLTLHDSTYDWVFLPIAGSTFTDSGTGTVHGAPDAPPTVTINQGATQAGSTSTSPIVFDVLFSEAVTGFDGSDVSFAGSSAGGTLVASVTGSGPGYTVSVTGMTSSGTVVASIPAARVTDTGGNPNAASSSTDNSVDWVFDAPPTVTINQGATQAGSTSTSPIVFDVLFSEAVTGFDGSDVSFAGSSAGGTLVASVTGSGPGYTVSVTGMTSSGTVVASIPAARVTDTGGNPNAASSSTDNSVDWVFDAPPTVTINQGATQAGSTSTSPIVFDVLFSEAVTGFDGSDVSFAGSSAGGTLVASVTGSGPGYTVSVTGMTSSGTVVASIPAARVTDTGGNPNTASTSTDNSVDLGPGGLPAEPALRAYRDALHECHRPRLEQQHGGRSCWIQRVPSKFRGRHLYKAQRRASHVLALRRRHGSGASDVVLPGDGSGYGRR